MCMIRSTIECVIIMHNKMRSNHKKVRVLYLRDNVKTTS